MLLAIFLASCILDTGETVPVDLYAYDTSRACWEAVTEERLASAWLCYSHENEGEKLCSCKDMGLVITETSGRCLQVTHYCESADLTLDPEITNDPALTEDCDLVAADPLCG